MARIKNSELMGAFCASLLMNAGFITLAYFQPKGIVLFFGLAYNALVMVLAFKNLMIVIAEEKKNDDFIAEVHRKQRKTKTTP